LNCCVTETKETPLASKDLHDLGEVEQRTRQPVNFIDHQHVDFARANVSKESLQCRAIHGPTGKAAVVI